MVLVLELAPGGELQMILDRDEVPEERQVARLLKQILDGIAFLHSLNVAHLDIKVRLQTRKRLYGKAGPNETTGGDMQGVPVNIRETAYATQIYVRRGLFSKKKMCIYIYLILFAALIP
ncbi:Serine/threonine-protein kinase 17A [Ooceraea biroi]|uniref:Serine/threonine-protein kinase 17A n=1 Tax=Ooceraea biroi TaxID=2015173 RepID=A0A026WJJ3_OOCBI|nr:Serine/threonine-protein kinase 17A [Ooceraea biroi]